MTIRSCRILRSTRVSLTTLTVVGTVLLLTSCASASASGPDEAPAEAEMTTQSRGEPGGIRTLAKIDGWREGLETPPGVFSALEVAYDATAAQQMWEDNVPAGLPEVKGDPVTSGRYGELSGVDFTRDVVALWSSGQSSSCPAWADSVSGSGADVLSIGVTVDTGSNGACTADRQVYRTVVVINREAVPDAAALPQTTAVVGEGRPSDSVLLAVYPSAS